MIMVTCPGTLQVGVEDALEFEWQGVLQVTEIGDTVTYDGSFGRRSELPGMTRKLLSRFSVP